MKSRLLAVGLVVLAAFAVCGCKPRELSGEAGRELVRDIKQAKAEVSLKGELTTAVRIGDRYVNAEATIHRGDGRLQLHFTAGKAKGVKIIEQGGSVWQIGPDGKAVRRLPRNPLDQMPPLGKKAVVTVARGARVLGRPTDDVVITPHPQSAARVEIWADKQTGFPLATDRYDHEGELVSSTRYTAVDFSAPAPEQVKLPEAPSGPDRLQQAEKIDKAKAAEVLGQEPLEPKYVPEGFELQGYYVHKRRHGQAVEVRYSDGVRLLNIVEIKLPGRAEMREAWGERQREAPDRGEAGAEQRRGGQQRGEDQGQRTEPGRGPGRERAGAERREREAGGDEASAERREREAGGDEASAERRRELREQWQQRREAQGQGTEPERGPRQGGAERGQRQDGAERGGWQQGPGGGERGAQQRQGQWGGGVMRSLLRGNVIRFRVGNLGIMVAGEVPAEELSKVADSMRETGADF